MLNPEAIIPRHWTISNFHYVLSYPEEAPFVRWLLNSVFVSTTVTLLVLVFSSMAAYAITRLRVPGGAKMLGVIVVTMMLPSQLFLVPVYLILSWFHWLDTAAALIVPATAGGFGVFMLAAFMKAIPRSIEEAAAADWTCDAMFARRCVSACVNLAAGAALRRWRRWRILHVHRVVE